MDSNDDFYGKELNLNYFYMHTNFGQKYLKTAIVHGPWQSHYIEVAQGGVSSRARRNWLWKFILFLAQKKFLKNQKKKL